MTCIESMIHGKNYLWEGQNATSKKFIFFLFFTSVDIKAGFSSMWSYISVRKHVEYHSTQSPKFKDNIIYHSVNISSEDPICSYAEAKC